MFEWSGAHAVFVPEIDDEHQEVFRLAGEMHAAIVAGAETAQLLMMCSALSRSLKRHFAHEEGLMRASHFGSAEWHQRQHGAATSALTNLRKFVRAGDTEKAIGALRFVAAWLRDHTSVADRILAAHIRNAQRLRTRAGRRGAGALEMI